MEASSGMRLAVMMEKEPTNLTVSMTPSVQSHNRIRPWQTISPSQHGSNQSRWELAPGKLSLPIATNGTYESNLI